MTELHPQILERDGKPSFVVLPYEEYMALSEELADLRDSHAIRAAAKQDRGKKRQTLEDVRSSLALRRTKVRAA